jgi:hypothetical protein
MAFLKDAAALVLIGGVVTGQVPMGQVVDPVVDVVREIVAPLPGGGAVRAALGADRVVTVASAVRRM